MRSYLGVIFSLLFISANIYASSNGLIQNEDVKSLTDITAAVLTTTGNVTFNSVCIASPGSTQNLSIGLYVYDLTNPSFIVSGTTVTGLPGGCSVGQIQIGPVGEGTSTGDTLTFGGSITQLINDSKIYVTGAGLDNQLSSLLTSNAILNGSSTAPALLNKLFINKTTSTSGFGSGLEIQNYNNTYSGILTDSGGRGFKIATSDYSDSTNTGSVLDFNLGAGTGNTYSSIQALTAGTSLASGVLALNASGGNVGVGVTNPVANLEVNGSVQIDGLAGVGNRFVTTNSAGLLGSGVFIYPPVNGPKTANYTLTNLDSTVLFDTTSGNLTATLPTAVGISGQLFTIFYAAGPNNQNQLIINTNSAQTIDGRVSGQIILGTLYDFITVQSNGSNWITVAKKETPLTTTTSYISANGSIPFSSFASGLNFPTLSNNSIPLSIGTWRLRAKFVLVSSGASNIALNMGGSNRVWFSANGNNTSTIPTALPAYVPYDNSVFSFNPIGGGVAGVGASYFQVPEYGGIITVTSGSPNAFAVPSVNVANPDTGQLLWFISAERIW